MLKIKKIIIQINGEMDDAERYAADYQLSKDADSEAARIYKQLADDELGHASQLHALVVRYIKEYRVKVGEPPNAMAAVWDYEHEKYIKRKSDIDRMLMD